MSPTDKPLSETDDQLVTILLAWVIAAILHLAIGSISVAAITAAGILAPILGSIGLPECSPRGRPRDDTPHP